jgi:hypothetical protein
MRKLILATTVLAMAVVAPCLARGGHGHGHHSLHGHSRHALSAPADPSAPSSLSSDAHVTNTPAPGQVDPEDAKLDQRIKSICRGC